MQLQTVSALYDQETVRNNGQPSYTRLKTSVRLHIDQMMRTRNFRARNEIVERESVTKSQIWRKVSVERKVGECYQWKAIGQYSKGDSCSFSHDCRSGKTCDQRQKRTIVLQNQPATFHPSLLATIQQTSLPLYSAYRSFRDSIRLGSTRCRSSVIP